MICRANRRSKKEFMRELKKFKIEGDKVERDKKI